MPTITANTIVRTANNDAAGADTSTKRIAVPSGATVKLAAGIAEPDKYAFDKYTYPKSDSTTGEITTANSNLTVTEKVVLTAAYKPIYAVKIDAAKDDKGAAVSSVTGTVTAGSNSGTSLYLTGADATATITVTVPNGYVFKQWEVTAGDNGSTGVVKKDDAESVGANPAVFDPTDATIEAGDTITLTPVFYKVATLAIDPNTYSKTDGTDDVVLTFTPNSGTQLNKITLDGDELTAEANKVVVTKDDSTGVVTYTLKPAWLKAKDVKNGYSFVADYQLGPTDAPNAKANATTEAVTLDITADKKNLTKAEIGVKLATEDSGTRVGTANVDHTDHKIVEKVSYIDSKIDPNELTWTWYYAASEPGDVTAGKTGTEITAEADGTVIVPADAKGKYVYAVVSVVKNAQTANPGSVLSNVIPVDYDASVVVNVDGSAIAEAAKGNYEIVLAHPTDTTKNVTLTGDDFSTDKYSTSSSALVGGVDYSVTINRVAGTTTDKVDTTKDVTPAAKEATVDFYTVTTSNFSQEHAKDSDSNDVGEPFDIADDYAVNTLKTGNNGETAIDVASGTAVLTGTKVTAKAKSWDQDYKLTWRKATGADAPTWADSHNQGNAQDKTAATGTGYTTDVTAKTYIGGVLKQNTYEITGDVYAKTTGASVTEVTLTNGGHVFKATPTNGAYTFNVPKSGQTDGTITADGYTLGATADTGSTILGYRTGAGATGEAEPNESVGAYAVSGAAEDVLRVYVDKTVYKLKAEGEGKSAESDSSTIVAANLEKSVELDYTTNTYTITLKNTGNTKLTVSLADPNVAAVDGGTNKITVTMPAGVTYGTGFELAAGASKEFKVAFADGLNVKQASNAVTSYDVPLAFTSTQADGATAGPAVTYTVKYTVLQAVITEGEITESGGKYTASVTEYKNSSKSETGGSGGAYGYTLKDDDVTYAWAVTDDTSNAPTDWTAGTEATYTPKADGSDAGKYLWVKITGQNNATGEVVSDTADGAVLGPQEIPYSLQVKINQDGAQYTGADPSTGKYKVEVVVADNADVKGDVKWDTTSNLFNVTGLLPSYTYTLKVSGVEGNVTNLVDFKTGIDAEDKDTPIVVDYYKVTYGNTSVTNAYTGMDGTGILAAGTKNNTDYAINSAIRTIGSTNVDVVSGNHVLTGSEVKFNTPDWTAYDYTRSWDRDAAAGGGDAGVIGTETEANNTSTYNLTYDKVLGTVTAHLTQKTYTVTAHVKGGTATELTMTNGKNIFTTGTGDTTGENKKINAVGAVKSNVGDGAQVSFTVPKGTYALGHVLPAGSQIKGTTGYLVPYDANATEGNLTPAQIEVSANGSYGLYLESEGYTLKIADDIAADAGTHTGQNSSSTNNLEGAELNESAGVYEVGVTRSYGWTTSAADTITLTLSNGNKSKLHAVKLDSSTLSDASAFTLTKGDFDGSTVDLDVSGSNNSITLALKAKTGAVGSETPLKVGTYTATLVFNFKTSDEAAATYSNNTTLTYKLTLKVEPNDLASVQLIDIGKDSDQNTEVNDGYHDVPSDTNLKAGEIKDSENNIIDPADVDYKWYRVPQGTTGVTKDNIGEKGTEVTPGSDKDTYPVDPADQGQDIYLLVVAKDDGSTSGSVLSHVANVKWTGKVFIHTDDNAVPAAGNGDPSYGTIKFVNGSTEIEAAWNTTDKAYESADLIAGTTYTVNVPEFKGSTNATLVAAGTVNSSDLPKKSNEKTVDYYTINYSDVTTATEFKTGTGADFTGNTNTDNFTTNGLPKLAAALGTTIGGTALPNTTPVLKGQDVTVYTKADWEQDYNAFWTVNDTADTTGQTPSASHSDGKTVSNISAKTTVTAALKQNTYTVKGTIEGGTKANLSEIKLVQGDITYTVNAVDGTKSYQTGAWGGEKAVNFTVPKGDYDITALAASGSTVSGMKVPATASTAQKGNTADLDGVQDDTKTFAVVLTAADRQVKVADDASHEATATGTGSATANGGVTLKYSYSSPAPTTQITLSNPGNTTLEVKVKVESGKKADNGTYTWDTTPLYDSDNPTAVTGNTLSHDGATVTGFPLDATTTTFTLADSTVEDGTDSKVIGAINPAASLNNTDDTAYRFTFTTEDPDANAAGPTVIYIFDLTVDPLPLKSATLDIKDSTADTAGVGDAVQLEGGDLAKILLNDGTTNGTNATAATILDADQTTPGTRKADIKYQWIRATAGTTPTVTLNTSAAAYALTVTSGGAAIDGETGKTYTATADDMGSDLYLAIYQTGAAANASGAIVAGPVKTQFLPKVKVEVDDAPDTTGGYTLYLAEDGSEANAADKVATSGIALTWDAGTKAYRPGTAGNWTSIDPAKTYNVWAQDAKGTGTATQIKTDVQFKTGETYTDNTVTVDYYTVNFEKAIQVSNTSDGVSSALKDSYTAGLAAKVGEVALTTGDPVLKNQKVTFTMTANQGNGEITPQNWSEAAHKAHYTAGWTGAGLTLTAADSNIAYPDSGTLTREATVTAKDSVGTTAAPVTATLTQKLYTVVFDIKADPADKNPSVVSATLAYQDGADNNTYSANGTVSGQGIDGETITFKVPAGDYEITATPGTSTVIKNYKVDGATKNTDAVFTVADNISPANVGHEYQVVITSESYSVKWSVVKDTSVVDQDTNDTIDLTYKYSSTNDFTIRLTNTGTADLKGLKLSFGEDNSVGDNASTGKLTTDWPDSAASNWNATMTKADKSTQTVDLNEANIKANGFDFPVGAYLTIPVDVPADIGKGAHAAAFTPTHPKLTVANAPVFHAKYTVSPTIITKADVAGITTPKKGDAPQTSNPSLSNLQVNSPVANTSDTGAATVTSISWKDSGGNAAPTTFAAGATYKVEVLLTAKDANYIFSNGEVANYTILAKNSAAKEVTATVGGNGSTLTLTYTFPATAAGDVAVTAETIPHQSGAASESGKITKLTAQSATDVDFYYVVTTSNTAPDADKIVADPSSLSPVANGKVDGAAASGSVTVTASLPTISGLNTGTTYYVYAVTVPDGETTTDHVSDVASDNFTTDYKVDVKVADGQTSYGSLTVTPANPNGENNDQVKDTTSTTVYIQADGGKVTLAAEANTNYVFKEWAETSATTGTWSAAKTEGSNEFTPQSDATIVATFGEQAKLKFNNDTWDMRSEQISEGYDANLMLLAPTSGRVTNVGTGQLKGDVKLIATKTSATIDDFLNAANASPYFVVSLPGYSNSTNAYKLGAGDHATVQINPATGLSHDGKLNDSPVTEDVTVVGENDDAVATYEAKLWAYDEADHTVYDMVTIKVAVASTKGFVPTPISQERWDLNNYDDTYPLFGVTDATHNSQSVNPDLKEPQWKVSINTNTTEAKNGWLYLGAAGDDPTKYAEDHADGAAKLVSWTRAGTAATVNKELILNTDYTYSLNSDDGTAATLEFKAMDDKPTWLQMMSGLIGYEPQAGDVFTVEFTLHNNSGNNSTKQLTMTLIDTTPCIENDGVKLTTVNDAATGLLKTINLTVTPTEKGVGTGVQKLTIDSISVTQPVYADNEVVVNWYYMKGNNPDPTNDTLIQGLDLGDSTTGRKVNKDSLTITDADAGKTIYAVVTGDVTAYPDVEGAAAIGHNYKGTGTTGTVIVDMVVAVEALKEYKDDTNTGTTGGGSVTINPTTGKPTGEKVTVTAVPDPGYTFLRWQVESKATGKGGFGSKNGDETADTASVDFYPSTNVKLQAIFAKLPELGIEEENASPASTTNKKYTYDYGAGAADNKTAPELYYVKNEGSGKIDVIIAPDGNVAENTAGFKADSDWSKVAGDKVTTLDVSTTDNTWKPTGEALKANLNPGTYTITYKDTVKGEDYDTSVTLTILNTAKSLPPVDIVDPDNSNTSYSTVTAEDDLKAYFGTDDGTVGNNATYQWYYGPNVASPDLDKPTNSALVAISGKTDKTWKLDAATVDTILKAHTDGCIYVIATGIGDYSGKRFDKVTVANPTYKVTVQVQDTNGAQAGIQGNGLVKVKNEPAAGTLESKDNAVLRQQGLAIEAIPNSGYVFDHWEVDDNSSDPKVYYGAFGSFKANPTEADAKTTTSAISFYPIHDAVVTAVFKEAPNYSVSVSDNAAPNESHDFGVLYTGVTYTTDLKVDVDVKNDQDAQKVTSATNDTAGAFTVTPKSGTKLNTNTEMTNGEKEEGAFTVKPLLNSSNKLTKGIGEYTATVTVKGAQNGEAVYTAKYIVSAVGTKDIDKPTNGGSPDFTATVLDDPRFDIQKDGDDHDVTWTKPDGSKMGETDKFEPTKDNEKYKASVTIKFDDGTQFPNVDIIQNYAPTFNGEAATIGGPVTVERHNDGTITITKEYTVPSGTTPPGGGGGTSVPDGCFPVYYWIGLTGQTSDPTIETVEEGKTPVSVPTVTPLEGYKFLGWTDADPAKLKEGEKSKLVDPTKVKITKDTTFYAVYETDEGHTIIEHTHYVIGYPNGTFGPADDITRGSVATIIARACLEGFVEGADYGNPGNYSDVEHDWAYSAISFCTMHGVFKGYTDGTFRPGQPITRQEFATVIARLAGIKANQGTPFTDESSIADWAKDGVYTAYANGWVNGYTDGTFKPLNNIRRDEAVKIFNGYLNRGVDAEGLAGMKEYVHTGVASNNTEDGHDEYMTWPDVNKSHWAYYEIIEAANDHAFYYKDETKKTPPETWDSVKIDERWRYHDNAADGGPQA